MLATLRTSSLEKRSLGFSVFSFARVVFMTKLLFFGVFQHGASFLFLNNGEICLAI